MKKALDASEKMIGVLCILGLAVMASLGILQVFFRYVLNNSLSFSEELMIFLFIWIIFLGAAICIRHQAHAVVEMVVNFFPEKARYIIFMLGSIINIAFLAVLTLKGFGFAMGAHDQLSIAMGIPMMYVYLSIPIGALFMIIYSVEQLCQYFIKMKASIRGQR